VRERERETDREREREREREERERERESIMIYSMSLEERIDYRSKHGHLGYFCDLTPVGG
jgi:hypothetical protein